MFHYDIGDTSGQKWRHHTFRLTLFFHRDVRWKLQSMMRSTFRFLASDGVQRFPCSLRRSGQARFHEIHCTPTFSKLFAFLKKLQFILNSWLKASNSSSHATPTFSSQAREGLPEGEGLSEGVGRKQHEWHLEPSGCHAGR